MNTSLSNCFAGSRRFNSYIGDWDTSLVTDMKYMFYESRFFNNGKPGYDDSAPLNFNTQSVKYINGMFFFALNFNQSISFNTSLVTDMSYMFYFANIFNQSISFDTSLVTDMRGMFSNAINFNNGKSPGDASAPLNFNTIKATRMISMFDGASKFNQSVTYDAVNNFWDTSSVTDMSLMFSNATVFNNGDVLDGTSMPMGWNVTQFGGVVPTGFSTNCALTLSPEGNSPFPDKG